MPATVAAPPAAAPASTPAAAPATAPAAAPAAKPATPAAPTSTTPAGGSGGGDGGADPFAAMDARILSRRTTSQPKPDAGKPDAGQPAAAEPAATPPAGQPAQSAQPPAGQQPKGGEPKQLRAQLEKLEKDLKERTTRLEELQREHEKSGTDSKALTERLAAREKELADVQKMLRALKREKSPEFVQKYDRPFNDAAEYAKTEIEQLIIQPQMDANGNITEGERQATWDGDFANLFRMPRGKAIQEANRLFGPAAGMVVNHLTELWRMDHSRKQALEAEMRDYEKTVNDDIARTNSEQQFIRDQWMAVNNDIASRNADWFGESKDAEENSIFKEALQVIDAGLSGTMTPQQKIVHDAQVRLRAAAAPRLAYRLNKAEARIAELETALSEAKGSKPGATRRPTSGAATPAGQTTGEKPWKADLRETMAQG